MLYKLGFPHTLLLLLLVLVFPVLAQSARVKLFQRHSTRSHHHYRTIKASSLATTDGLLTEYPAHPHIQMVTTITDEAAGTQPQEKALESLAINMLDTPVSGPNPGGNSASLAATPSSQQNLHNLGDMLLHKPVSGPNPGGNNQVLSASSSQQVLAASASSGPNPGDNSNTLKHSLIDAKPALKSVDSISSMLPRTPVQPSAPSKGHNSIITGKRNLFEEDAINGEEELIEMKFRHGVKGLIKMKVPSAHNDRFVGNAINMQCGDDLQRRDDQDGGQQLSHHNPFRMGTATTTSHLQRNLALRPQA